jgi:type IV secretion system protein VirD4
VFENNVLLTQTERLMMNSRPKQPKYARNKNVLVVGGSGSGKTRFFVKPNLMQMHSSYLVSDPKGTLLLECGKLLERGSPKLGEDGKPVRKDGKLVYEPYRIKVLNTINFKKSMKYNPFAYLRDEKDILKLVNTLIANTKGSGEKSGEDFWVKAERLLYCALIGYIHYEAPDAERNFTTLLEMINASEAREDDSEFQSPVDLMFERLEEKDPEHFAVKQYKKFLLSAGKTRSSILISCGARLAPFDIKELRELMESDELELDTLGDRKTALFIITSDTDPTFDFVTAMIVSQLFNLLCTKADDEYGGRLPIHVRCLLDEVANITIPNLERLISVLRSREISACLVVQAQSQLKAIYKEHADTIIGNCDTTLFLGGKEKTTLKEISEVLGKETIDSFNTSENRGRDVSHGLNYQKLGKELMSQDEIAVMDGGKCILQLRGVRPFFSDKYDITKHPKYKYLSDYDKKNTFDIEKFLKRQRRPVIIKPDTVFDYYEIDAADLQEVTE